MSASTAKRVPAARDAEHPIHAGVRVAVLGLDFSGRPIFEGRGVVVAPASGPHRYLVRFDGAPASTALERFVHPEYQRDPQGYLAWMTEFWAAARSPAISDFFPD